MKWTNDWLKDYLETDASAEIIADTLTRSGLEIEGVEALILPVAAKVLSITPHATSGHLNVLILDDGGAIPRQVVCGAPNVRLGMISALAKPGCIIGGKIIKSGALRGVLSDGMMCSGAEIGISDDADGILDLDESKEIIGQTISALAFAPSVVFDAGITPNRPDYLSVPGIARDLYAAGIGTLKEKSDDFEIKCGIASEIIIEDAAACPVYAFAKITGIKNTKSNGVISKRLAAIGINPKNACVDATNYVCNDMGQPMHCFDADAIVGSITVRSAKEKEEFTDLFGTAHILSNADLVIADEKGILALAGIIGGTRGMTTDDTRNIILEAACFNPVMIRKTAKRLGLSTDASYRFERGIYIYGYERALKMATDIIIKQCGGSVIGAQVLRAEKEPIKIPYTKDLFKKKTGIDLAESQQVYILEKLGFVVGKDSGGKIEYVLENFKRVDVLIPENIVSELIRIYGYDKISLVDKTTIKNSVKNNSLNLGLKKQLCARGLSERVSFGFGNSVSERLVLDKKSVIVLNPIIVEMDTARNSLVGNMLDAIAANEKRGYADLNLFELGTIFDGGAPGMQRTSIVIARTGATSAKHWQGRQRPRDVFDIKADIVAIIGGNNFTTDSSNPPKWAHPYRYGKIILGGKQIAQFAELHPSIAKHFKIKTNVMIGVIDDIKNIPVAVKKTKTEITDFQPIKRDFAFITDVDFSAEKIVSAAKIADLRIADIVIFDSFEMANDKKSVAFSITILPNTNMTDADLLLVQNAVIKSVESTCPAKIRDA